MDIISTAIITLLGLSFILAYMYGKVPEDQQHFRILFMGMSLLVGLAALWSAFAAQQLEVTNFYDDMGVFSGNKTVETSLDAGIKDNLIGVGSVLGIVFGLILLIILVGYAFDRATAAVRKRKAGKKFISDV